MSIDLATKIGDLELKNFAISAASPLGESVRRIERLVDGGFGAVFMKTAPTYDFTRRYPRPQYLLLDWEKRPGDPNYVPRDWKFTFKDHQSPYGPEGQAKIASLVADYCSRNDCKLLHNVVANTVEEFERSVKMFAEAGCDGLELNLCCPYPAISQKDEGAEFAGENLSFYPERGAEIAEVCKKAVDIPIFAKLPAVETIGLRRLVELAKTLDKAGIDGLTCTANGAALRIDIESGKPYVGGFGPYTGPSVMAFTEAVIARIAQATNVPIMGGRGIDSWRDAVEMMMAGASAVQLCTSVWVRGPRFAKVIIDGVEKFMQKKGYKDLHSFVGLGIKNLLTAKELVENTPALVAQVDHEKCNGCGRCEDVCAFLAVRALPRKSVIDRKLCQGCTLCSQICPVNAISMKERAEEEYLEAVLAEHPDLAAPWSYPY